jgi:hypothetical protein
MTTMPHLPTMRWNDRDQLEASARASAGRGHDRDDVVRSTTAAASACVKSAIARRAPTRPRRACASGSTWAASRCHREYAGDAVTIERETLHGWTEPSARTHRDTHARPQTVQPSS